jgi:hypothetical protein
MDADTLQRAIVALQAFQVALLWTHDWLPLGRLNDVRAVRAADSTARLVRITLIQSLPFTLLLAWSAARVDLPWHALVAWLAGAYGVLFAGELKAWWIPYLIGGADPARVERHRAMFGGTHAFLPERHGVRPNTLHTALHAATLATLLALARLLALR